jgi:hypothetical protein
MKKSFVRLVFATFICGIGFIGCKEEGKNEVVDPQSNVVNDEILIPSTAKVFDTKNLRKSSVNSDITPEIEFILEDIAKNIANNMNDIQLRKLLKNQASLKKDGDFDILISSLINEKQEFQQMLSKNDNNFFKRLIGYVEKYPKLNISIPLHIDKWDEKSKLLLVAALRNHEEDYLTAYGFNNLKMLVDHNNNPDKPVIIVGFNERIEINKTKKSQDKKLKVLGVPTGLGLQHTNANSFYLTWLDVVGESSYEIYSSTGSTFSLLATTGSNVNFLNITGLTAGTKYFFKIRSIVSGVPSAYSSLIASSASPRNDGQPLQVTSMRFNSESDLRVVEKWASGAPELRLRVVVSPFGTTAVSYTTPKLEPSTRNAITNQYWVYNVPLLSAWNSTSTVLRFNWREEDWNDNGTFTVNANWEDKLGSAAGSAGTLKAGIGYSITDDPGKDLTADTDVFYWDPLNTIYQSTIFKFKLNE